MPTPPPLVMESPQSSMITISDGDTVPTVPPTPSTYYTTRTGASPSPPSVNRNTPGGLCVTLNVGLSAFD